MSTSLTTTGYASLSKNPTDSMAVAQISGTYGTAVMSFEGCMEKNPTTSSNWFALGAVRMDTNAPVTGSITPSDNAEQAWLVPCTGCYGVRVNLASLASGTAVFDWNSFHFSGIPFVNVTTSATSMTGNLAVAGTTTGTSSSASALTVGLNGATNPALKVDASTASSATGLQVKSAAAASGMALSVVSSGTNENLTVDAKGSGTISLNVTGTGNIVLGRAATGVSLAVTAGLTSSGATGAGIGYATGAGGAVTQATNITTGVTLNTLCGTITTVSSTLAAGVDASFTLTNSTIAAGDTIVINTKSYGGTADGIPICKIQSTAAGSAIINVHNQGAVALDAVVVMNYAVIKAVAA